MQSLTPLEIALGPGDLLNRTIYSYKEFVVPESWGEDVDTLKQATTILGQADVVKWQKHGCALVTHRTMDSAHFKLIVLDWQHSVSCTASAFSNRAIPCSSSTDYFSGSVPLWQEDAFWKNFAAQTVPRTRPDSRGNIDD